MGGVIYIGDRKVGKTHLAQELANPDNLCVTVDSIAYEKVAKGGFVATKAEKSIYDSYFEVKVHLPTGEKIIRTNWLDTPGEIWRSSWQSDNPQEWQNFLQQFKSAQGILLILDPYREIINPKLVNDITQFVTRQQWITRFERWVQFLKQHSPNLRQDLLLCLNKADLFCSDLKEESQKLAYDPDHQMMNWQQKDQYVYYRYFSPVHSHIKDLNKNLKGLSVRCFITSLDSRELLELPWIYLGLYLAEST
ncbi:MAG: hypothetical protein VKL41_10955 [Snowella sp.]|nr:hypothetical protein [Snowella sp.]